MNTKIRLMMTLSLLITAILLSACGQSAVSKANPGNGATTGSAVNNITTPASAVPLAGGESQTAIANAKQLLMSQKAYRIRTTAVSSMGEKPRTSLIEVVTPDRLHNIDDNKEIITIGKIMYVKEDGKWQNLGTQMSDMQEKMMDGIKKMSAEERADATRGITGSYKSLGDETLDGVSTNVYELHGQVDTKMEGVAPIVTITKYWIGKSDGLIHKEESDGGVAGMKVKTTRVYEYDPNINIEAPLP